MIDSKRRPALAGTDESHDIGPLENEFAPYRQRSPQWRDRVQAGNHALDIRGILAPRHGRRPHGIRTLTVPPSPSDVAERSEALRLCHVSRMARILSTQTSLASLLFALFARPLPRAAVPLCGRDERAGASCGASVDSLRKAQFSLDDVVHEVMWDVVIVTWRWIHRTRRLACKRDDDRIASFAAAPKPDVHRATLKRRASAREPATPAQQDAAGDQSVRARSRRAGRCGIGEATVIGSACEQGKDDWGGVPEGCRRRTFGIARQPRRFGTFDSGPPLRLTGKLRSSARLADRSPPNGNSFAKAGSYES